MSQRAPTTPRGADAGAVVEGSTGFVPRETTLRPPRLRAGLVARGELIDTLREQSDLPVVLVTGPPGYGKTTLLAQWDDEDSRPFVWLTLDASCNDPTVLVTYVLLGLQRLTEPDVEVAGALADRAPVRTVLLPLLGRMMARLEQPYVLVLDDAEVLTAPEALDVVSMVLRHLGEGAQLALASRTHPDLPWSQLRTERRLLTIGPEDLGLTPTETRAVLASTDVELPPDDVATLLERTEGWPAGVYLTALSLQQAAETRRALATTGARGSVVVGYLRELLAGLPPETQRFLVRTSVLTSMSAPLCDAVLGTSGSGDVLRELERSNLFVVPLDDAEQWYRYHHVFGDVLRAELAREDPSVVARLHSAASRWLEEAGDPDEAIRHAQAASEVERAARLVWSQAATHLANGRVRTLQGWLDRFTPEQVAGHAKLALAAAHCALETGQPVDRWIAAAESGVYDATRPGAADEVRANLALLHAQRGRRGVAQLRTDVERALELQAPDDPWRAFAQYLQAVSVLLAGAPEDARGPLVETGRLAEAMRLPSHQALCRAQLAVLALEAGDADRAWELASGGSALLAEHGVPDAPTVSLVHCATTLLLARRGRTDEARALARRCMRMVAVLNQNPPWLAVETRWLLGRAHLLMGDTAAARVLLSEAQTHIRGTTDATWLADRLDEAWAHVRELPLATGVGPTALTSAEMRVLQLLPTHLSFEQIGRTLLLSRNTVKTQAIAAYRKLGVSSRTEAVARAAALGMV